MSNDDRWDPAQYCRNAAFVSELGMPLIDLLAPRAGERILDLGCGEGTLMGKIAGQGASVRGVDSSAAMVAAAKAAGLDAEVADGEALGFSDEFDAVFSNAALHWMKRPERVIDGVWRALRPGGRFVAEMGAQGNVETIVVALEAALSARGVPFSNPWYFPRPDEYKHLLEARGFDVTTMQLIPRPTLLPGDVGGWLETFAKSYVAALPEAERKEVMAQVVASLRGRLRDASGNWYADYMRLRFRAMKPAQAH